MSIVPVTRVGKIEFYEAHVPVWLVNAVDIGLTAAQVNGLGTLTVEARKAYNIHVAAQDAARAATESFYNNVRTMQIEGADLIRTIKNLAETTDDPNVYVLAAIPAPSPPTPAPPPGTPTDLRVELLQTGAITLTWKCPNPSGTAGTIYEVQRRSGGPTAPFVYVGATGVKSFTDESLPYGPTSVTYQITAIRSTASGNPAQFTLSFGVSGEGFRVANVVSQDVAVAGGHSIDIPAPVSNGNGGAGRNGHRVGRPAARV